MTLDEANEQLVKAVEIEYKDMFEDDYSDDEDYDFCLKRSMEEDNISEAVYFINNDGMLCALAQMKFVTDLKYYGVIVSV